MRRALALALLLAVGADANALADAIWTQKTHAANNPLDQLPAPSAAASPSTAPVRPIDLNPAGAPCILQAPGANGLPVCSSLTGFTALPPLSLSGSTLSLLYDNASVTINGGNELQVGAFTGAITKANGATVTAFGTAPAMTALANGTGGTAVPTFIGPATVGQVFQALTSSSLGFGPVPAGSVGGGTPSTVAAFNLGGVLGSATIVGPGLTFASNSLVAPTATIYADGVSTGTTQLASVAAAGFSAGTVSWVTSVGAYFKLVQSTLATAPLQVVAASGKGGYVWQRLGIGNADWGAVTAWWVDPANASTFASDENSGASSGAPLLSWGELGRRLSHTVVSGNPTVTLMSDTPSSDVFVLESVSGPAGARVTIGIVGTTTQIATGTMSAVTNPASISSNSEFDFTDAGNTFTTWIQKYLIHRTNGTQAWAWPYSDRGSHVLQTSAPQTSTGAASTWAVSDAYEVLSLPKFSDVSVAPGSGQVSVTISFADVIGSAASGRQLTLGSGLVVATFNRSRLDSSSPTISGSASGGASLLNVCLPATSGNLSLGGNMSISGGLFAGTISSNPATTFFSGPGSVSFSVAAITTGCMQFTLTNGMIATNGIQVMTYDQPVGGTVLADSFVAMGRSVLRIDAMGGARNASKLVGVATLGVAYGVNFASWNAAITSNARPYVVSPSDYTAAQLGVDTNQLATQGSGILNASNLSTSIWSRDLSGIGTDVAVVQLTDSNAVDHPIGVLSNNGFMQLDGSGNVITGPPPGKVLINSGDVTADYLANKLTATAPLQFTVTPGTPPLSGLQVWLNGSNVTTSGSNVTAWPDQSGHGNNFANAGSVNPVLLSGGSGINGHPAVRFTNSTGGNRTNNSYLTATINPSAWAGVTVVYVLKTASSGSANSPTIDNYDTTIDVGDTTHSVWWAFNAGGQTNTNSVGWAGPTGNVALGDFSPLPTNSQVLYEVYQYDKTTWTMSGAFSGTKTDGSFPSALIPFYVGTATYPGSQSTADIGDVLVYDHKLSGSDMNLLAGYIQAEYGITIPGAVGELTYNATIAGAIVNGSTSSTAQNIGALTTGLMKNNVTAGVGTISIAAAGTDYQAPGSYISSLNGDAVATGPGAATLTIQPQAVSYAKIQLESAHTILGNAGGAPAAVSEIALPLALANMAAPTGSGFVHDSGGVIDSAARAVDLSSADATGTLAAARFPALLGPVTTTAGSLTDSLNLGAGGITGHLPVADLVPSGTDTWVLTTVAGIAVWQAPAAPGVGTVTNVSGTSGQVNVVNNTSTPVISLVAKGAGAGAYGGTGIAGFSLDAFGAVTAVTPANYMPTFSWPANSEVVAMSGSTPSGSAAFEYSFAADTLAAGNGVGINGVSLPSNAFLVGGHTTNANRDRAQFFVGGGALQATGTGDNTLFDILPTTTTLSGGVTGGIYSTARVHGVTWNGSGQTITEAVGLYVESPIISGFSGAQYAAHLQGDVVINGELNTNGSVVMTGIGSAGFVHVDAFGDVVSQALPDDRRVTMPYGFATQNTVSICTGWIAVNAPTQYQCAGGTPLSSSALEYPTDFAPASVRMMVYVTAVTMSGSYNLEVVATQNGTPIGPTQCNYSSASTPPFLCDQGSIGISGSVGDRFGIKLIGSGSGTANSISATATLVVGAS